MENFRKVVLIVIYILIGLVLIITTKEIYSYTKQKEEEPVEDTPVIDTLLVETGTTQSNLEETISKMMQEADPDYKPSIPLIPSIISCIRKLVEGEEYTGKIREYLTHSDGTVTEVIREEAENGTREATETNEEQG